MIFDIDQVIYSYLFICITLLFYNIIYIFYSDRRKRKSKREIRMWKKAIYRQVLALNDGKLINPRYKKRMVKKLVNTNRLVSYVHALDILSDQGIDIEIYLKDTYIVIQTLAYKYIKKDDMDRAFFAFFISKTSPPNDKEYTPLMDILISYLKDSTVYCRENVLKALYAIGNSQAIENAFRVINDKKYFHHQKLISDGLLTFTGDKEELAERLWSNIKKWEINLAISIVHFITESSDKFKERFFEMLNSHDVDMEIKLAVMRYYRRHIYEPVRPQLISYVEAENEVDENMKIVAAAVLDRYPGRETVEALKLALNHSNWYFRYNAASSLVSLKVDITQLQDVLQGKDRFAKEILTYMIEKVKEG